VLAVIATVVASCTVIFGRDVPVPLYGISLSATDTIVFPARIEGYGTADDVRTVIITNSGNMPTGALTIELSRDNAFALSHTSIDNIEAGKTDWFTVAPKPNLPASPEPYTATVRVTDNEKIGARTFNVEFMVAAKSYGLDLFIGNVKVSDTEHEFGPLEEGYEPQDTQWVQIRNTGNRPTGDLTITLYDEDKDKAAFELSRVDVPSIDVAGTDSFPLDLKTPGFLAGTYKSLITVSGDSSSDKEAEPDGGKTDGDTDGEAAGDNAESKSEADTDDDNADADDDNADGEAAGGNAESKSEADTDGGNTDGGNTEAEVVSFTASFIARLTVNTKGEERGMLRVHPDEDNGRTGTTYKATVYQEPVASSGKVTYETWRKGVGSLEIAVGSTKELPNIKLYKPGTDDVFINDPDGKTTQHLVVVEEIYGNTGAYRTRYMGSADFTKGFADQDLYWKTMYNSPPPNPEAVLLTFTLDTPTDPPTDPPTVPPTGTLTLTPNSGTLPDKHPFYYEAYYTTEEPDELDPNKDGADASKGTIIELFDAAKGSEVVTATVADATATYYVWIRRVYKYTYTVNGATKTEEERSEWVLVGEVPPPAHPPSPDAVVPALDETTGTLTLTPKNPDDSSYEAYYTTQELDPNKDEGYASKGTITGTFSTKLDIEVEDLDEDEAYYVWIRRVYKYTYMVNEERSAWVLVGQVPVPEEPASG
jgi:hypothetical protein